MNQSMSSRKKLVIANMHGPLLSPGEYEPPAVVAETVKEMYAQGIDFVPVSSLPIDLAVKFVGSLGLTGLGVLDDGATVYDFYRQERNKRNSLWLTPHSINTIVRLAGNLCKELSCDALPAGVRSQDVDPEAIKDSAPFVKTTLNKEEQVGLRRIFRHRRLISVRYSGHEDPDLVRARFVRAGATPAGGVAKILRSSRYQSVLPNQIMVIAADEDTDHKLLKAAPPGALRVALASAESITGKIADISGLPATPETFVRIMRAQVLQQ